MPDFSAARSLIENGNEVRLHGEICDGARLALGVDIGSTSTKMAVVDAATKKVIADIYRKTEGNPLGAAAKIFGSLEGLLAGRKVEIAALGTTGSGRKLVGEIAGADTIVNEITAHYRGAHFTDPDIETIIEIGGQDSKYIRAQDGMVVDCNMNFVCAAGTGSFIEEQAHRLGFDIREVGEIVHGLESPRASDRCTVFMEQDINALLRDGFSRSEALAAVIRSIAKNYLNRVVGPRPLTGERIAFMGATARNRGLVAAFESLTGREIVVSPWCHVMGAFGAALIAIEATAGGKSRFRGLDAFCGDIAIAYETCGECPNGVPHAGVCSANGREESWGYLCGRESVSAPRPPEGASIRRDERPDARSGQDSEPCG
jgi:predicted CoA-substrate-specific enzyme activase